MPQLVMAQLPLGFERRVYSVTQIQNQLRRELESRYRVVSVRGEISNVRIPTSGHAYFSLKDRQAQIRCFMWRDQLTALTFRPDVGREVVATGKLTIYEKGGDLQMVVDRLETTGVGALHEQYERCLAKLRAEGLMDPDKKKRPPAYPNRIGIVTSPTGAALRDVLRTIFSRDPDAHVVLSETKVQGQGVAFQIVSAIRRLDGRADVIILCRGGGSLEDLWAFNEEPVARAIAEATTPIVTGVGHETDTTIADLVADVRASTPTGAAEFVVPIKRETRAHLDRLQARLTRRMDAQLTSLSRDLHVLSQRLRDPASMITRRAQMIDDLLLRAERAATDRVHHEARRLRKLERGLGHAAPAAQIARTRQRLALAEARHFAAFAAQIGAGRRRIDGIVDRLHPAAAHQASERRGRLRAAVGRLEALSPLAVLSRGYAVATDGQGRVIRAATEVSVEDPIEVRLGEGRIRAMVVDTEC